MMRKAAIAAALFAGLLVPAGAWAQRLDLAAVEARPVIWTEAAAQNDEVLPLDRITEIIARRIPGRRLNARLDSRDGVPVYLIAWSTQDGRRIDLIVDARNGRILEQRGG